MDSSEICTTDIKTETPSDDEVSDGQRNAEFDEITGHDNYSPLVRKDHPYSVLLSESDGYYQCAYCKRNFVSSKILQNHLKRHNLTVSFAPQEKQSKPLEKVSPTYFQYKMGFCRRLMIVNGAEPSKFTCQKNHRERMNDAGMNSQSAGTPTDMCDVISENTLSEIEAQGILNKSIPTEAIVTAEISGQCEQRNNIVRSKVRERDIRRPLNWSDQELSILFDAVKAYSHELFDESKTEYELKHVWHLICALTSTKGLQKTTSQIKKAWNRMKEIALLAYEKHVNKNYQIGNLDMKIVTLLQSRDQNNMDTRRMTNMNNRASGINSNDIKSPNCISATDQIIEKLDQLAYNSHNDEDNEFSVFGKHVATQLNKLPVERAVICQEKIQSILTQERLLLTSNYRKTKDSASSSPVSESPEASRSASPSADNENSSDG